MFKRASFLGILGVLCLHAAEFPEAQISNGVVTAKLYLPDNDRGYYRGTRFDWSGVIYSLRANGHEYFGQWFEKYDPKLHDAITGPVEEFVNPGSSVGYEEAQPGETFIRIGVGAVRKPEEKRYRQFNTYEIVDPGSWAVKTSRDSVRFVHKLRGPNGYAYEYTKVVRLPKGRPELVIEHRLKNTGTKAISTTQYNHNFFVMDGKPTGPGASVQFAFTPKAVKPFQGNAAEVRDNSIVYLQELQPRQSVYGEFASPGDSADAYDLRLEHKDAGAGVRIRGDKPISKLVFWSIRTTFCPEPYINIDVQPGRDFTWTYTYNFYSLE